MYLDIYNMIPNFQGRLSQDFRRTRKPVNHLSIGESKV